MDIFQIYECISDHETFKFFTLSKQKEKKRKLFQKNNFREYIFLMYYLFNQAVKRPTSSLFNVFFLKVNVSE